MSAGDARRAKEIVSEWLMLVNARDSSPASGYAMLADLIAAALAAQAARLDAITGFTLAESAKVPESLRGDRDWWQQNAVYWKQQADEARAQAAPPVAQADADLVDALVAAVGAMEQSTGNNILD